MVHVLTWSAAAFAAVGALAVSVLVARRVDLARAERRRQDTSARLLPTALALLDGDDVQTAELSERDAEALAALLARLARHVRGEGRTHIARFFERRGMVDRTLRLLGSRRAWRRAAAAHTLGDMGSPAAVPALHEALSDPERSVRAAAARSLGCLAAVEAVDALVFAFAEGRIPRSVAGHALLSIGQDALPALRALETADDPEARAFAVELVGFLGDASDDDRLVGRLNDTSADVRAKAARALGRLGAEHATAQLVATLADRIPFVRVAAADALASVGDRGAVPALLEAARSDRHDAARAAARAAAALDAAAVRRAAMHPAGGPFLVEAADLIDAVA